MLRRTSTRTRPSGTPRRFTPIVAGAVVAAAGLVFGSLTVADAVHPSVQGDSIPNVTQVESQIKAYYGARTVTYPNVGSVTIPASDSDYATEVEGIAANAKTYLAGAYAGVTKPAVVFDIDDTTLNTYDYEIAVNFAYTPSTNETFVDNAAFPAVFGMPSLVNWAERKGYTVFFLTGRPEAQRTPTVQNLRNVGYHAPLTDSRVYLKPASPPPYLTCVAAPTCTTIEYKSGTRKHIEHLGYDIVADFGDQYSDLSGGYAGHKYKLPNPMYYLP